MSLGVMVLFRKQSDALGTEELLAIFFLCFMLLFTVAAVKNDVNNLRFQSRARRMRAKKQVMIPPVFQCNNKMLDMLEIASDEQLAKFRSLEKKLIKAVKVYGGRLSSARRTMYDRMLDSEPRLLDHALVKGRGGSGSALTKLVSAMLLDEKHGDYTTKVSGFVEPDRMDAIVALWLSEGASVDDRKLLRDFAEDMQSFEQGSRDAFETGLDAIKDKASQVGRRLRASLAGKRYGLGSNQIVVLPSPSAANSKRPTQPVNDISVKVESAGAFKRRSSIMRRQTAAERHSSPPAVRMRQLLEKAAAQRADLFRLNAMERVMDTLLDSCNCETVILIPAPKLSADIMPRIVVRSSTDLGDLGDSSMEAERLDILESTDWNLDSLRKPAGLCFNTKPPAAINVKNALVDKRFDREDSMAAISQLCIPILANKCTSHYVKREVIGVLKLLNKVSFAANASGLPFKKADVDAATVAALLIVEASQSSLKAERSARRVSSFLVQSASKSANCDIVDSGGSPPRSPGPSFESDYIDSPGRGAVSLGSTEVKVPEGMLTPLSPLHKFV